MSPDAWMKKVETVWANNRAGNSFENTVREALELPMVPGSKPIDIDGYRPDFPINKKWGITDVKNVQNLTSSPQLDAFYKYAKDNDLPFNIVIDPNTKTVSAPLIEKILETGGSVKQMKDGKLVAVPITSGQRLEL